MGKCMDQHVNKLMATGNLEVEELKELIKFRNIETTEYLFEKACTIRQKTQDNVIQLLGRIPISSYCKYDCKMCGIRRDNQFAKRFRLDLNQILKICHDFEKQGVKHFLLEGGDDVFFTEKRMAEIILAIKKHHPDSKIILSIGEKGTDAFRHWFHVGASGYILRHGSANELHFKRLYPSNMSLLLRKQSLWELKQIGYEVGTGFLIGIPYQTIDNVVEDIRFIKEFGASVVDMGAFVPALRTPFERERSGNGDMTLYIMAILRLMLPNAAIIASPTLDCVMSGGRMRAFEAGANVLIVDAADNELMEYYRVYERKNGRLSLPMDDIARMKTQLSEKGLKV